MMKQINSFMLTVFAVLPPLKSGKYISESGLSAAEAEGVTFLRMEKNKAVFKVQSGKYEFESIGK